MIVQRLFLRNYRVFEDDVDIELPGGVVGIYGPNGAGKSVLLDAIPWTLFGRSRTKNEGVRTAGVHGDCVTEVTFEHEGHRYTVRRTITGVNHTVKSEAFADDAQIAAGVNDVKRYVHSVLGMDDTAFKASVFAEQKQIAGFSGRTAQQRRDLVLRLLGITSLESARDAARADARRAAAVVDAARAALPDVDALEADTARLSAAAERLADEAEAEAAVEERQKQLRVEAEDRVRELEVAEREHARLVEEGRRVRAELDEAVAQAARFSDQLTRLIEQRTELEALGDTASPLEEARRVLEMVSNAERARTALDAVPEPPEPLVDPETLTIEVEEAQRQSQAARDRVAEAEAHRKAEVARLAAAESALRTIVELGGDEECPTCGQPLGDAVTEVEAHRRAELDAARSAAQRATLEQEEAAADAAKLARAAAETEHALRVARRAWEEASVVRATRAAAEASWRDAIAALGRPLEEGEASRWKAEVAERERADRLAAERRGAVAAIPTVEAEYRQALLRRDELAARRDELLASVKALGFDPGATSAARAELEAADSQARQAGERAAEARDQAVGAAQRAAAAAGQLEQARKSHAALETQTDEARHLSRVAELLGSFRNTVLGTMAPRLAHQAASLFHELTGGEYDLLDVSAEDFGLRIVDQGVGYDLERFSGSEQDLANLALRVAISEQVGFQSGGAVGLLVLDEVFGSLDEDRKDRLMLALERLRARFRQVLVVTHITEVKEQLPTALEVVKVAPRRAKVRLVDQV